MEGKLEKYIKGKNVLFITTHRIDYIRNTQEIKLIEQHAKSIKLLYGKHNNHILSSIKIFIALLLSSIREYDVIFVSYMSQLIIPVLSWKLSRKTIVVDFFISLYDSLVYDRQVFKKDSIGARICHTLDSLTLKDAKLIIADTNSDAMWFTEEFDICDKELEVLYLEADKNIYFPKSIEKYQQWNNKLLVLYFGTIIPLQGVDTVLDVIDLLGDADNIHFLMIGPIGSKYKKPHTHNVTYIDWLSQEELADYIAMADLCLAGHFNDNIQKANRTIPGKAYIYEAMNKTMVLGDSKANHELFQEDNRHRFVKMGDAAALAKLISDIAANVCKV
ncbi:glycosyltransferase [Butyrivibrio sp. MC2013]|uniref:glycosyltransferase n=1 Tax=Butyrivibrio sp. MC2013 TaxID=1280686 RepID=UPI0004018AA2|nr:glycosyltransferase [Butyrivibrio sp. MC2013]